MTVLGPVGLKSKLEAGKAFMGHMGRLRQVEFTQEDTECDQ